MDKERADAVGLAALYIHISFCISATKAIRLKDWRMPSFLILSHLLGTVPGKNIFSMTFFLENIRMNTATIASAAGKESQIPAFPNIFGKMNNIKASKIKPRKTVIMMDGFTLPMD